MYLVAADGRRFRPSMLLVATTTLVATLLTTFHIKAEAGGKGKGVPIYMPIPIPIPMPVGPGPNRFQHHHHHRPAQQHDDGEGEVKKIYLLQPMPVAHPQPHLKGGGFMGGPPVQNNIHFGQSLSPGKHRHSGGGGQHKQQQEQQQQQQQHHHHHIKSASEVKILPIVVIPPVAPMPPVQVPPASVQAHSPRMTLTPQFNNYVMHAAGGLHDRKRSASRGGLSRGVESFADYGGSLGGSVFREQYASRSRPGRGRAARVSNSGQGSGRGDDLAGSYQRPVRSRDFDYGDYDGQEPSPRGSSAALSGGSGHEWERDILPAARPRQQYRRLATTPSRRVKSIRDIIEQSDNHNSSPYGSDEALDGLDSPPDKEYDSYQSRYSPEATLTSTRSHSPSSAPSGMEISLDELSQLDRESIPAQLTSRHQQQQQHQPEQQQDLGSYYYDRADSPSGSLSSRHNSRGSRWRHSDTNYRGARSDERDLFEDDEWSFDTIKSVQHVERPALHNNQTMTVIEKEQQQQRQQQQNRTVNGRQEVQEATNTIKLKAQVKPPKL